MNGGGHRNRVSLRNSLHDSALRMRNGRTTHRLQSYC